MSWFGNNWKRVVLVLAGGVAALTADHTVAHKLSDFVVGWLPALPW